MSIGILFRWKMTIVRVLFTFVQPFVVAFLKIETKSNDDAAIWRY